MTEMQQLRQRLADALQVTVLMPEDYRLVYSGAPVGDAKGQAAYLSKRPKGYIQLRYPQGLITSGLRDLSLMPVECIAADAATAQALAQAVRQLIGSTQIGPSIYRNYIPPTTLVEPDVGVRVITSFQVNKLTSQ